MIIFPSLLASAVSLVSYNPNTGVVANTYQVQQRSYTKADNTTAVDNDIVLCNYDSYGIYAPYTPLSTNFKLSFSYNDGTTELVYNVEFYYVSVDYLPYVKWSFADSYVPNIYIDNLQIHYSNRGSFRHLSHKGALNFWYDGRANDYTLDDCAVPYSWQADVASNYISWSISFDLCVSHSSFYHLINEAETAFENGRDIGYADGYKNGKFDGVTDFQNSQEYADALDHAEDIGYANGKTDGIAQSNTYSFIGLFGAIADTPILILRNLLGFDVFGVSALSILMTMITASIALYLFRKIFFGRF